MRKLTSHKVNELNEAIEIEVVDVPSCGEANHEYDLLLIPDYRDPLPDSPSDRTTRDAVLSTQIRFQDGPIQEAGVNGISNEALLAIVEDRLQGFQRGEFSCRENAVALTKLQECIMWLHKRTRDRVARGVEGTHEK